MGWELAMTPSCGALIVFGQCNDLISQVLAICRVPHSVFANYFVFTAMHRTDRN